MERPEASLTGKDANHVTGSERVRMRYRFPRFFLIIVEVQNVSLHMTDMATGSDRSVPLEGCVHAQPEVAQYPPYWGLLTGNNVMKRHP